MTTASNPRRSDRTRPQPPVAGDNEGVGEEQPRRFTRGRLSRGKGLRTSAGCLTCRRRRIKCDESKPCCIACTRKSVECFYKVGSDSIQRSRNDSFPVDPPTGNSIHHGHDKDDDEAFEFDQSHTETRETDMGGDSQQPYSENGVILTETVNRNDVHPIRQYQSENPVVSPQTNISSHSSHMHPIIHPEGPSPPSLSSYSTILQFSCPSDSANGHFVESPTARWLNLLINDATLTHGPLPDFDFDANGLDIFGNTAPQTPVTRDEPDDDIPEVNPALGPPSSRARNPVHNSRSAYLQERLAFPGNQQLSEEKQSWEASEPIELREHEHILFRHFVDHISQWMDLFEPQRPFGTLVPHLALHNVGLMNAIMALSARHLALDCCENPPYATDYRPSSNDAVGYYYKTLHYSQKAMQYDTYKTSLELLSISIIISSYEMLDGSSANWQKHLEGVFWIQRSQVIHGDSNGLRQAIWWAWISQDVWAAFREKRKPFTFWRPTRTLAELDPREIAARSVHNLAQVVAFCSGGDTETELALTTKKVEADRLLAILEQWKSYLTLEFNPLPITAPSENIDAIFSPVWVRPAAFAVAMQVYYSSLILIHLNRPLSGGLDAYLHLQRQLKRCATMVCGIATTLTDYASGIMSSQCVFIAGMTISGQKQRAAILELLDAGRRRTGWPGNNSLGDDLKQIWQRTNETEA